MFVNGVETRVRPCVAVIGQAVWPVFAQKSFNSSDYPDVLKLN